MDRLSFYLCPEGKPRNFIISGGSQPGERYEPLYQFFGDVAGRLPTIVLHDQNPYMEALVRKAWEQKQEEQGFVGPLLIANCSNPVYEPFYGMSDNQITTSLRMLATRLGFRVTSRFENTVGAHLDILRQLSIPASLSGMYYLCQFVDMGEFYRNVMSLPCGQAQAQSIWSRLGASADDPDGQFDLFRSVINNLAGEAERCAWNTEKNVSAANCLRAIEQNATLVLSVNGINADLFLSYLVEELKGNRNGPFIMVVDGVRINDRLLDYLRLAGSGCCYGIVAENAVGMAGGDEQTFSQLAENTGVFILFKHATSKTAEVLSGVLGRCDQIKTETARGRSRSYFSLLPQGTHDDVRYSTENRFRVMPEEITGLQFGQAIVFDTQSDQIIRYNC